MVTTFVLPLVLPIAVLAASCTSPPVTRSAGTFIEEFDGFPIYHGEPRRRFRVLASVYDAAAAARGVSPMKRAAVAAARDLGADAIVLAGAPDTGNAESLAHGETMVPGSQVNWQRAVAIEWQ